MGASVATVLKMTPWGHHHHHLCPSNAEHARAARLWRFYSCSYPGQVLDVCVIGLPVAAFLMARLETTSSVLWKSGGFRKGVERGLAGRLKVTTQRGSGLVSRSQQPRPWNPAWSSSMTQALRSDDLNWNFAHVTFLTSLSYPILQSNTCSMGTTILPSGGGCGNQVICKIRSHKERSWLILNAGECQLEKILVGAREIVQWRKQIPANRRTQVQISRTHTNCRYMRQPT